MDDDFSAWAAEAERPLIRSAYLLTGDLHRSEDLVQEAMVKVALRWSRLRDGHPTAYARRVIARDHVSLWRRRGREVPVADPVTDAAVSSDPETVLVVRRALDRLTPAQRAVVVLRHFDDLTERETADTLGVSIGTVKSQNAVALARLRTGAPELLDLVQPTGLGEAAAAEARRRRTGRRVVAASVTAVVAVAAVLLVVRPGDDGRGEPAPVAPTTDSATDPAADAGKVFPEWDPFTIADAPLRPSVLPARIEPPEQPASVLDEPIERAVLAWPEKGRDLRLLDDRGGWRSVPGTADAVAGTLRGVAPAALSDDGRKVAVSVNAGLRVIDVTTGDDRLLPWPDQVAGPWDDAPDLLWLPGGDELAILHWADTWVMDLEGGIRKPPWGREYGVGLGVDRDGGMVEQADAYSGIDVWRDDTLVRELGSTYWTNSIAAGHGRVAMVGWSSDLPQDRIGPMVVDGETGELVGATPVRDPDSAYSHGSMTLLGLLDADTVLIKVAPRRAPLADDRATWYLAAWDARTGAFERLASGPWQMSGASVALGVLAAP